MKDKRLTFATTAYEKRKKVVDVEASQRVFSIDFAIAAFEAGDTAGPGRKLSAPLKSGMRDRVGPAAHGQLARCCQAYVLAHENGHAPEEQRAYQRCVRRIRDGAKEIAQAADELAAQLSRHAHETGTVEARRADALIRLACSLHGDFRDATSDPLFIEKITPRRIDNRFADNNVIHGLTGCAALFDEAERILKEYVANQPAEDAELQTEVGMRTGNKSDADTEAFVLDLAELFVLVIGRQPTAHDSATGAKSPFVRFVLRVFDEILTRRNEVVGERAISGFDRKAYAAPSTSTLKSILKKRASGQR